MAVAASPPSKAKQIYNSAQASFHALTPAEAREIVDEDGSINDEYKEQLITGMVNYSARLHPEDLRPVNSTQADELQEKLDTYQRFILDKQTENEEKLYKKMKL